MASKRISRLIKILSSAVSDVEDEIIQFDNRWERYVHFWAHVYRSFIRNRCMIRASALSYTTLLALIPLLAVAISVTSSLLKKEGEDKIYQGIDKFVGFIVPPTPPSTNASPAAPPPANKIVSATQPSLSLGLGTNQTTALSATNSPAGTNQPAADLASLAHDERVVSAQKTAAKSIHDFVQRTQSGALGATGMLLLVFVAIRMLANIEATFNDIWGVSRGRSWVWRIVLYWTTITLGPMALVGAVGLAGSSQLHTVKDFFQQMPFIGSLIFDFIPLVLLWIIFALVYLLVPNTKVNFSAAFVGGMVAGSLWHLNNVFGFVFASRLVTNSKIYGSLALVPVFMVGLFFSWLILLFGAQVAHAFQNRKSYLQEKMVVNVNQRGREFVALRLMTALGQRFQQGLRPVTVSEISNELNIPNRLAQAVLRTLAYKQLVTEVAGAEIAYVPARPLEHINAHDILTAIRTGTGQELPVTEEPALKEIYGEFARIEQAERETASVISLLDLANRLPARAELAAPEMISEDPPAEDIEPDTDEVAPEPAAEPAPTTNAQPKDAAAPTATATERRRDVVRPAEDGDFPL